MASVDPIEEPSLGDEYERRTLVDVLRSVQERAMPVPLQNPTSLPLHQLDPEVFERVMAEVIARQHNLGTYFYGRRGQTQYGLDIVERETDSRRSLYQVKRYQSVTTQISTRLSRSTPTSLGTPRLRSLPDDSIRGDSSLRSRPPSRRTRRSSIRWRNSRRLQGRSRDRGVGHRSYQSQAA